MQLTERHLIKPNHELYATLDDLTFKAKNLYNHGLYLYRQSYFEHKSNPDNPVLSWVEIDKSLRNQGHADIRALPSKVANAVLKNLGENISSFWKLVRLKNKGGLAQKPKLPGYLHKTEGRYPLSFNYQTFGAKRGSNLELFLCPKGINLPIPTKVTNPKQVRIVPNHNNFVIEVIYNVEEKELKSTSKYAGIDLGVDNFATVTFSTHNNPLIIKGLELKSINQGYNRLIAKAQELLPETCKTSKSIHRLWSRRTWILTTKIHQMTAFLATLFDEMQIEKVFIGKNTGWKQELPFGKKVKQRFAYLPYETFIEQLQYKCQLRGITVVTQEESYTSKASFLDNDDIPVYGEVDNPKFSGRRIKRGLYRTGDGRLINADVNGSYNILRKGLMNNHQSLQMSNPLTHPLVVKGIGQEPNDKLVRLYM
jgi:putative transposase